MRARALVFASALAGALAICPAASAKGPSQAVVTGPSLSAPVSLRAPGSKTIGRRLADMVQYSGFFPEAFGGGDTLRKPPEGDLGPRYTVRYRMTDVHPYSTLVQDVYPFAAAGPVTSMDRGQSIWGERTKGGWFVGRPRLAGVLRDLGIRKPEPSPSAVPSSSAIQSHLPTGWIVIGVVLVLAAGAALLRARRAHLPA